MFLKERSGTIPRVPSIDILRGTIMILMAIDHVRVYSGMPAGGKEPGIFFTRWITHFSAPGFAFFAGTAIFFLGQKLNNQNRLSRFLFIRGLLLVLLEITLIRFFWTFNFNFGIFFLAGVIWMLGWCMILMAVLVKLRPATVGIIGIIVIVAQQAFRFVPQLAPLPVRLSFARFWNFIYPTGLDGPEGISILYVIVPWVGVMAAGYGFGLIMDLNAERRRKICLATGLSCILLFLILGTIFILKGPSGDELPFALRLLNQNKYPASQLFLLMTLGPLIALIPLAESVKGWLANVLSVFGRVPFFYYLSHILLIHLTALIINYLREGFTHQNWYSTAPYVWIPEADRWGLPLLYLVFIVDVVLLYFLCRWYSNYKSAHGGNRWLRYI